MGQLTDERVPEALELLTRSFHEDPLLDWLIRSDSGRERGMRTFFDLCMCKVALPYGEVCSADGMTGVALWTPPGKFRLSPLDRVRFLWRTPRCTGLRSLPSRLAAIDAVEKKHPRAWTMWRDAARGRA